MSALCAQTAANFERGIEYFFMDTRRKYFARSFMRETLSEKKSPDLKIDSYEDENPLDETNSPTKLDSFQEKDSAKTARRQLSEIQNPLMHESF